MEAKKQWDKKFKVLNEKKNNNTKLAPPPKKNG